MKERNVIKMKKKIVVIILLISLMLFAKNILAMTNLVAQTKVSTNELEGGQEVLL